MIAAALLSHRRHHAADRRESIPQVAGDLRGRTPHHLLNPLFGLRHKPGTGCRMQLVPVGAFQLPAFGLGEIIGMQRIAQGSHHPGADTPSPPRSRGPRTPRSARRIRGAPWASPSGRCGGIISHWPQSLTTTPPAASISANSAAKAPNAAPGSGVTTAALLYDSRIFRYLRS